MKRVFIGIVLALIVLASGCLGGGNTTTTTSTSSPVASGLTSSSTTFTSTTTSASASSAEMFPATLTWDQEYVWTTAEFTLLNSDVYEDWKRYSVISFNIIQSVGVWKGETYTRTITGRTYFEIFDGTYLGDGTYVISAYLPSLPDGKIFSANTITGVYKSGTFIGTYVQMGGTWVATIGGIQEKR